MIQPRSSVSRLGVPRVVLLGICLAALSGCAAGLRESSRDAKITARVRALLAESDELGGANEITVQTDHGIVYLRGLVSTPYQIEEAGSVAAHVPHVLAVRNLIVIENSR